MKLPLFIDNIDCASRELSKESVYEALKLINKFSKVIGYKITI